MLARVELLWGDWQEFFKMYDITFATTPGDLQRLASTYFNVNNRTLIQLQRAEAPPAK